MVKANRFGNISAVTVIAIMIMIVFVGIFSVIWLNTQAEMVYAASEHIHRGITFEAWDESDSLPSTAGDYYLTQNVNLSEPWNTPTGITNLCLNGFGIIQTGYSNVINVGSGATFNLYECTTTEHFFDLDDTYKYAININDTFGEERIGFTGGYITGGNQSEGSGICVDNGTFNMYGGNIIGNHGDIWGNGGGVLIGSSSDEYENAIGSFTQYGGSISYNYNNAGAGVYVFYKNTFTLNGGIIHHNYGGWSSGIFTHGNLNIIDGAVSDNTLEGDGTAGICIFGHDGANENTVNISGGSIINNTAPGGVGGISGPVSLSGSPVISNNIANNIPSNLYVSNNGTIDIVGELSISQKIGVTLSSSTGVFTSGWTTYMGDANPTNYFVNDVGKDVYLYNGEAYCGMPSHEHDDMIFTSWAFKKICYIIIY